MTNHIKIYWDI